MSDRLNIRLASNLFAEAIALESMAGLEHNLSWDWIPRRMSHAFADPETKAAVAARDASGIAFGIRRCEERLAHL